MGRVARRRSLCVHGGGEGVKVKRLAAAEGRRGCCRPFSAGGEVPQRALRRRAPCATWRGECSAVAALPRGLQLPRPNGGRGSRAGRW